MRIKLSGVGFARSYILKKAQGYIGDFLSELPEDVLVYLIQHQIPLESKIDPELLTGARERASEFGWAIDALEDIPLFKLLPDRWQQFFADQPGGVQWATQQLVFIRSLMSGQALVSGKEIHAKDETS